jgi:hypothetical protein
MHELPDIFLPYGVADLFEVDRMVDVLTTLIPTLK